MNSPVTTHTSNTLLFVALSAAPWLILTASVIYAISAIGGFHELTVAIPFGVAFFYKDLGFNGHLSAFMIPISYLGALIAAVITTVAARIRTKTIFLAVICCIIATNYIGCSSMRDEWSRARIGG
jgi:hypothetical protein